MRKKMYYFVFSLMLTTYASFAQQWAGSSSTTGVLYRDGNVGIGTTSPQAKLDVAGQALLLSGSHRIYINEFTSFDRLKAGIRNNDGHLVINAKDSGILYLNRDV